jgi:hypothetical protein
MIRFFRSIRQGLINEGKTSKYFRYAIGEILLVMIGILLALQVNNWNEGRKLDNQRLELVEELKVDFEDNLDKLNLSLPHWEFTKGNLERVLEVATNNSHLNFEELKSLFEGNRRGYGYRPSMPSYEMAKASGSLSLIKSTQLKRLFIEFDEEVRRVQQFIELRLQDEINGTWWELRRNWAQKTSSWEDKSFRKHLSFQRRSFESSLLKKKPMRRWRPYRRLST